MRIFAKRFLISCAVCAGTAGGERAGDSWDDRDFHGSWKLSRADSEFHTFSSVPPPETMDIEQKGTVLHCRTDVARRSLFHEPQGDGQQNWTRHRKDDLQMGRGFASVRYVS
jgi:hypothetical protein